jgi:hypothetical protein
MLLPTLAGLVMTPARAPPAARASPGAIASVSFDNAHSARPAGRTQRSCFRCEQQITNQQVAGRFRPV